MAKRTEFDFNFNVADLIESTKKLDKRLKKELKLATKSSASEVESYAKNNHRFTTRNGDLVKSISSQAVVDRKGFTAMVQLKLNVLGREEGDEALRFFKEAHNLLSVDEASATAYGEAVHQGHGSWGADRFIPKAMAKNLRKIQERWKKAIDVASKDF